MKSHAERFHNDAFGDTYEDVVARAEREMPIITPEMIDNLTPAELAAARRRQDAAYKHLNKTLPR